jgi:hypothetical protein
MKTQVSMTLVDFGWTEEQAAGLLDSLSRLSGSAPPWKPEHLKRLHDWCSAHGKDHKTIEGQLEFIAFDICNDHEAVGLALKLANTRKEANRAVEPYVRLLQRGGASQESL